MCCLQEDSQVCANNVTIQPTKIHLTKAMLMTSTNNFRGVRLCIYYHIGDNVYFKFWGESFGLIVVFFSFIFLCLVVWLCNCYLISCECVKRKKKICMIMWGIWVHGWWWIYLRSCVSLWTVKDLYVWVEILSISVK